MARIAFLLFQSLCRGSFLHDAEISMLSGRLRAAGAANDVLETILGPDDEAGNTRLLERLADRVAQEGYGVLVFHRLWDVEIPRVLRRLLRDRGREPVFLLHAQAGSAGPADPFDAHLVSLPLPVFLALSAADAPLDRERLAALLSRAGAEDGPQDETAGRPRVPSSNFTRIRVNPESAGRPPSIVIHGNPGCPYRRPIPRDSFWSGVELDPRVTNTVGCSFCDVNLGERYRLLPGVAEECARQIQDARRQVPDAFEMVLLDQDPFPFLPELFGCLLEARARPLHLLIQARADLFLDRREEFEQALVLARRGGHRLTPFLVGLENFHQPTLDLYNKGVTVETNVAVLRYLDDVAQRFADVYDRNRVRPGFILWHPWVTLDAIRANVEAIRRHGLGSFRSEFSLSKLRLYPSLPFYWKARRDGLLTERYPDRGFDSARRYGYPEEHPYRFASPEAQSAYTLLAALVREIEPDHELDLLDLVVEWVHGREECRREPPLLALERPSELVELFRVDAAGRLGRFRTARAASGPRSLPPGRERAVRRLVAAEPPEDDEFELACMFVAGDALQLLFAPRGEGEAVRLDPRAAAFQVALTPRTPGSRCFARSARFDLSYSLRVDDARTRRHVRQLCARICRRDGGSTRRPRRV